MTCIKTIISPLDDVVTNIDSMLLRIKNVTGDLDDSHYIIRATRPAMNSISLKSLFTFDANHDCSYHNGTMYYRGIVVKEIIDTDMTRSGLNVIKVEHAPFLYDRVYGSGIDYFSIKSVPTTFKRSYGPKIEDVIFNDPATIVFWKDGTKTVVKCQKGEKFDKEKGLAMAIVKKVMRDNKGNFNDIFREWCGEDK